MAKLLAPKANIDEDRPPRSWGLKQGAICTSTSSRGFCKSCEGLRSFHVLEKDDCHLSVQNGDEGWRKAPPKQYSRGTIILAYPVVLF
jgi:hypothetical protein